MPTGRPHSFSCKKCKLGLSRWSSTEQRWIRAYIPYTRDDPRYPWKRTGRERQRTDGNGGNHWNVYREFVCRCGHVGWSSNPTVADFMLR
jgi:hypothetical protein